MTNTEVARVFEDVADLLEIQGADVFRVNAYRRVARTINDLAVDINEIAQRGELAKLPGVGKSSA
ncbi:MAG TPA: helix-hairpin-helix domain-containing protein, partial [Phycisphaerae bacterium]|nr:helix-hairpin-helix domain-containing protein [Phycisphaerae bacterium]